MEVVVRKSEVEGIVSPPPSKSYTHRAFIAASLSRKTRVGNPLLSEDTMATLRGCAGIGARFHRMKEGWLFRGVDGIGSDGYFYFANSGTTLRFFLSLLSLSTSPKFCTVDGDESLRGRPNRELAESLKLLGARVSGDEMYRAPVRVGGILKGGDISMTAPSSQFVSSLLFSLPLARGDSTLRVKSVKSKPYIEITLDVLERSGVDIGCESGSGEMIYEISGGQTFKLREFEVPADFSSASYLIAAGLLAGKVRLLNIRESKQGDARIVEICREMGGKIRWRRDERVVEVEKSTGELHGVEVDASDIPDLVPTISVLAAAANGETRIYNAEHLRLKEIDRINGIARNLISLGVDVKVTRDSLVIRGGRAEFRGTVNSFGDHRMALAFSLLGLLGEVRCVNAEVVSVSYPGFFDVLRKLGANVQVG